MDRSKFDEMMAKSEKPKEDKPAEPVEPGMQFGFDVVEVQRVGLQPGDVLMVTVKNDDLSQASVDQLRQQLQLVFSNNKVFVFAMRTTDDVKISVVSDQKTSYCSDCSCGKKAQAEAEVDPGCMDCGSPIGDFHACEKSTLAEGEDE